jgi:integrase
MPGSREGLPGAGSKAMPETKRGRPVTGSPKRGPDGRWTIRVPIPKTNRTRPVKLGPEIQTEERATEVARHWHEKLKARPDLLAPTTATMTVRQYLQAWTTERKGRVVTAEQSKTTLENHVLGDPALANKPAAAVTPDDLRRVVARLNDRVEAGAIEASTARQIWARARCMFRQTFDHEKDTLRLRKDDPTAGVRPPRKGADKQRATLYPDEASKLLSCLDVPFRARRQWALLLYTGMRVSELNALDWASVDIAHRRITVHETIDHFAEGDDETKAPKTGEAREIDMLPGLVPLLEAMHRESGGTGRVLPDAYASPARSLRGHLLLAGITRAALHTSTKTQAKIRAQDLRATTATWLGLCEQLDDGGKSVVGRRVSATYARDLCGHAKYETTEKYYERGRGLRVEHVGTPFAPLPEALLGAANDVGPEPADRNSCQKYLLAAGSDIANPAQPLDSELRCRSTGETVEGGAEDRSERESCCESENLRAPVEHASPRQQVNATAIPVSPVQEIADPVESALADAIGKAAAAGAWDALAALTAELRARREAKAGVVLLDAERKRRERGGRK